MCRCCSRYEAQSFRTIGLNFTRLSVTFLYIGLHPCTILRLVTWIAFEYSSGFFETSVGLLMIVAARKLYCRGQQNVFDQLLPVMHRNLNLFLRSKSRELFRRRTSHDVTDGVNEVLLCWKPRPSPLLLQWHNPSCRSIFGGRPGTCRVFAEAMDAVEVWAVECVCGCVCVCVCVCRSTW